MEFISLQEYFSYGIVLLVSHDTNGQKSGSSHSFFLLENLFHQLLPCHNSRQGFYIDGKAQAIRGLFDYECPVATLN